VGSYRIEEVVERWGKGELSSEQAIGQSLLHVQSLTERVGLLEQRLEAWRQELFQRPPAAEKSSATKTHKKRRPPSSQRGA
jgi:hypothetical protein